MFRRHVALGLILYALLPAAAVAAEPESYAGWTLTEALLDLEARGLKLLFTSHVVRDDMRVAVEPDPGTLRQVLDQLLEAHGLEAREGPGGTLVVVPRPVAAIRGQVRERRSGRPVEGVQLVIQGTGFEATSGADGGFELSAVLPGLHTLEARRPGYVVERRSGVVAVAGRVTEVDLELIPAPVPLDEIVVTPSTISLLRSEPVPAIALSSDEIAALPHLGDDLFRALTLLPGISGNEFSARFHVRGGRSDEVLVQLDQLELFEPYHLKDFESALSIIAPQAIGEMDLILGGFPAQFGDRMGGVLDMTTLAPTGRRALLGLSIIGAQAGGAGTFADGQGEWLGVARYGSFKLVKGFLGPEEQPAFWDAFGKVEVGLGERQRLGGRLLHGDDRLQFVNPEDDAVEQADNDYQSSYLWLTHQAFLGTRLFVDSVVSAGRVDRDRRADEVQEEEQEYLLRDHRVLEVSGFKQSWNHQPGSGDGERHYLRWGFDLRRLLSDYDYLSFQRAEDLLGDPDPEESAPDESDPEDSDPEDSDLNDSGSDPPGTTTIFRRRFRGEQYGVYLSDRLRLWGPLTAELGLRYDEHTLTGDRDLSPRVNLVAALGPASTLRAAWGHFFQGQRLYELQVEDGVTEFFPGELTEHYVLGFEHRFRHGETLRLDLYHRDVRNPRPRFENLFEPVDPIPEIQPDRVRIAPERSTSQGVELFLRGRGGAKLDWWLNYAWAEVEDEIDGRDVPRAIDQPHTLNVDVAYRVSRHWTLNLAFRYHTGWPTTAVEGEFEEDDEGELEPVLSFGPRNGERLPVYHRLDLRVSRQWRLRRGSLSFFLDLQNLYDRSNLAGFDVEFEVEATAGGGAEVIAVEELWGGFLPSIGIEWEF